MMTAKAIIITAVFLTFFCPIATTSKPEKSIKIEKVAEPVKFGEEPHWDVKSHKLFYVSTLDGAKIIRYDPVTKKRTFATLDREYLGPVVPVEGTTDKFIVGVDREVVIVTWDSDHNVHNPPMKHLSSIDADRNDTRVQDGKCDAAGRFWIGTMVIRVNFYVAPSRGSFYKIGKDGTALNVISPVSLSNGMAWNLKNDVMYYIDTPTIQIWGYDFNVITGTLSNKRVVFDVKKNNLTGKPDGMTIDTDGNLWVVLFQGKAPKSIKIEKIVGPVELGEGPHWDVKSQTLYYVDLLDGHKIIRYNPATKKRTSATLNADYVGAVVPVEGTTDKLIAAVDKKVVIVTWNGKHNVKNPPMKVVASLDSNRNDTRVNDGKCDAAGRFWIGTMAIEVNKHITPNRGSLYRIDTDGKANNVVSPISIGNGLTWSVENDIMYYIDSPAYQVWAFDYNNADGTLSNKRVVFDIKKNNIEGLPDGMTNDADGNLWVALHGGQAILQIDPKNGKLLQKIELPTDQVTSVAFGGPRLDELYVTTSRYGKSAVERQQKPDAGSLYRITGLGIKGVPAHNCKINA